VWDRFLSESNKDYERARTKYEARMDAFRKKIAEWEQHKTTTAGGKGKGKANPDAAKPTPPLEVRRRLHEDEPVNFLRLSTVLKLMLSRTVTDASIQRGAILYEEYVLEYKRVSFRALRHCASLMYPLHEIYGVDAMKPNHHWAVHLPDQLRDYGPVHNFWTFLTERLNKLLKSSNTNHWTGGQLEISMMREFYRSGRLQGMVRH
jgi:hypothetical protein